MVVQSLNITAVEELETVGQTVRVVKDGFSLKGQKMRAWNRKRSFQRGSDVVSRDGASEKELATGTKD
jgi:hypothetical protein